MASHDLKLAFNQQVVHTVHKLGLSLIEIYPIIRLLTLLASRTWCRKDQNWMSAPGINIRTTELFLVKIG